MNCKWNCRLNWWVMNNSTIYIYFGYFEFCTKMRKKVDTRSWMNESLLVQDKKKKVCLVQQNASGPIIQGIPLQPFSKKIFLLDRTGFHANLKEICTYFNLSNIGFLVGFKEWWWKIPLSEPWKKETREYWSFA